MTSDEYPAEKSAQSKSEAKILSGNAYLLYMENGQAVLKKDTFIGVSLRHVHVITEVGSLAAEFGNVLSPRDEPYIMPVPGQPYNIDFRTADGVYFIRPTSGIMVFHSEHAGPADTYNVKMFYLNVRFEGHGRIITINGTAEATIFDPFP